MYELLTTGQADLINFTRLVDIKKIARDPLTGVVDGSNPTFFANFSPLLSSGSTSVLVSGVAQTGVIEYDTGQFNLNSAPSAQPFAWYTFTSWTVEQMTRVLLRGFDEMESRWARGFRLSSSSSSFVLPTVSDAAIYLIDKDVVQDPVYLNGTWSLMRSQVALYMKCCEFAYYAGIAGDEARVGTAYREAVGMSVNTAHRSPNLEKLMDRLEKEVCAALFTAQNAWYSDGSGVGAAVLNPQTLDYKTNFEWQVASKDGNWRNLKVGG